MHSLSRVQRWHVARLAPAQSSGKSCEKVSERAGQLPRVWKLEWSEVWVPGGVQFNANTSRCRKGFRQPPVGQVQQLQSEKRAVERQVGRSIEITALARVGPL